MQLVTRVMIAAARTYVRRGLAIEPTAAKDFIRDHELSWLARRICKSGRLVAVSGWLTKSGEDTALPMNLKRVFNASK
jgi:hypothetical protein